MELLRDCFLAFALGVLLVLFVFGLIAGISIMDSMLPGNSQFKLTNISEELVE